MFRWFHCILDIIAPYPDEMLFPTEGTLPVTGEEVSLMEKINTWPVLLLLVVLILLAVGIVYFVILKKTIAAPGAEVSSEENKE